MPGPPVRSRLLITGASGYIGSRLVARARARGLAVVAAVREPRRVSLGHAVEVRRFDLAAPRDLSPLVAGIDAVVHLAAELDPRSGEESATEERNVRGSEALLEAARRQGVRRFLFVSSQSAAAGSPTAYGRAKWRIEQLLGGPGEAAVRPGLVCGGAPRGLWGELLRRLDGPAVLPAIRPPVPVYPVHVDDLCDCMLALIDDVDPPPRLVHVGPARPMDFTGFLRLVARWRLGRRVFFLPVPALLLSALGRLGTSRERLRGLLSLPPVPADLIRASVAVCAGIRAVAEPLANEGRRRRLAAEGGVLMSYVLGRRVGTGVVRRYVRAVLAEPDPEPLWLPPGSRFLPLLAGLVDPASAASTSRYRRRLEVATRIVEMTPAAAACFHRYRRRWRPAAWLELGWILLLEATRLPLRRLGRLVLPKDELQR